MSANSDTYLACVAQSMRDAEASTLSNVRERCLRSAAAWQAMADRALHSEAEKREKIAAADLVAQDA